MEKLGGLSVADIAAVTNRESESGMFGGNCWWILMFLFFSFFGFGGNNFGTRNLQDDMNTQFIERDIFNTNQNVSNTACQTQREVLENRYTTQLGLQSLQAAQQDCCCKTQNAILNSKFELDRDILQNRYDNALQTQTLSAQMAQCCCDTKNAIHAEGEATRALITQNTIEDLREKLAQEQRLNLTNTLVSSNQAQTQNLVNMLSPRPVPAYPSCSPYMAYNWGSYFGNNCGCCNYNNI